MLETNLKFQKAVLVNSALFFIASSERGLEIHLYQLQYIFTVYFFNLIPRPPPIAMWHVKLFHSFCDKIQSFFLCLMNPDRFYWCLDL